MCNLMEARPEDTQTYFAYLRQMYDWIHWNNCPSWNTLQQELRPLTEFYLRPQTELSRTGILCLLGQLQTETDYQTLIILQRELTLVWIEFSKIYEMDYSGESPYTFFYFISKNPEQALDALNRANEIYKQFGAHTHHILEYLFRLGKFVAGHQHVPAPNGKFMDFFLRRSLNFLSGIDVIRSKLVAANPMYDNRSLVPTNGDMHCDGKVPCFVTLAGEKFVYKPRDMRIDQIVINAFAFCSQFLEEELRLPLLQVQLLPDNTGLMQFAFQVEQMSREEAETYFTKLGVLLCFSKLFGVRDLHHENIMATLQGPVIIDMECALNAEDIQSQIICDSSLKLLQAMFRLKATQNATFMVEGEFLPLKNWVTQIHDGFSKAAACLYKQRQTLTEYYQGILQSSIYYRIVPISTDNFYDYMHLIITLFDQPSEITKILEDKIYVEIFKCLYNTIGKCIPPKKFEDCLKKDFLLYMIYVTLFYGNIPILHMEVVTEPDGTVFYTGYINGVSFFEHAIAVTSLNNLTKAFVEQIRFLNSKEALKSVDSFFSK